MKIKLEQLFPNGVKALKLVNNILKNVEKDVILDEDIISDIDFNYDSIFDIAGKIICSCINSILPIEHYLNTYITEIKVDDIMGNLLIYVNEECPEKAVELYKKDLEDILGGNIKVEVIL